MHESNLEQKVTEIAALLADNSRTQMLFLLMDGRAYTATELSVAADIAPSTASAHLNRLVEQNLVNCIKQGRYRYFQIESEEVAGLLENMMCFAHSAIFGAISSSTRKRSTLKRSTIKPSTPESLRFFRTCYDHMAGEIAVKIHRSLLAHGWLTDDYQLTSQGKTFLLSLGAGDIIEAPSKRKFACGCLDWSERCFHLGGFLGAVLLKLFLQKKWAIRQFDSRKLVLTEQGKKVLIKQFGIEIYPTEYKKTL
ncbi:MAG: ArsR family transcriptional regulator [Enterobacteriaceae bacterium]|jgi:DNA-binding transcriptional ArsR family regulator|nr:ArsR family transcriptional regulator [Enterobacteriaceae bacterium]